ncbi:MAG: NUDIX hydrolase [Henriciella sp.]|nr:NUDIX hydrolase [Henriciella sp.]
MTVKLSPEFALEIPDGDDKERSVCQRCEFIDYQNPKIVAGSVVLKDDKILLCKRAIEPRKGFWTLPAGFMELGESVEEAAQREAKEEALADIEIDRLLAVYSVPRIGQVQVMFRAHLNGDFGVGPESADVKLVDWKDIPWSELAFPTVVWALTHYAETRDQEVFTPFANPDGTDALTR